MVQYKIHLKFKDDAKSLNEMIIKVLKMELEKKINMTCNILTNEIPCDYTHYSLKEKGSHS